MTQLPRALRPWADELELFPDDVAAGLGSMLPRLAALVGPLAEALEDRQGDPDGFDGLSRRGAYERLLISEWALAEEYPDEFLRRAATGEQSFLRRARRIPKAARRSVVLLDTGPGQLGAPRVGQLAALVLLARRARDAGVVFAWGLLQDRDCKLHTGLSAETLGHWKTCRLGRSADDADLSAWEAELGEVDELEDRWIVGSSGLSESTCGFASAWVGIADSLEPGERGLQVTVERADGHRAHAQIELPEPLVCLKIVRDPLSDEPLEPRRTPSSGEAGASLLFSPRGDRLFVPLADGRIAALHVPNSPNARPGKPKFFEAPPREDLVAVGWHKSLQGVTRSGHKLIVRGIRGGIHSPDIELGCTPGDFAAGRGALHDRLLPCWSARSSEQDARMIFCTPGGRLRVARADASLRRDQIARQFAEYADAGEVILDYNLSGEYLGVVRGRPPGPSQMAWQVNVEWWRLDYDFDRDVEPTCEGSHAVNVAPGHMPQVRMGSPRGPDVPVIAVSKRERTWVLVHGERALTLHAPTGAEVVGAFGREGWIDERNDRQEIEPTLLILEHGRRRLSRVGRSFNNELRRSGMPIVTCAVSPARPHIAWTNEDGEVVVYSTDHDAELLRVALEEVV
ncbi:hypothetical protein FIV42_12295 [Persicimonas caeni]|uniref:Uncharacterized protein n=1 Tax=Persicimonas caeni TaxID=2292766 RepID=A0A4Y6PT49_PERCE|nr:hypothetical protein [Persicimonas caeni]QDG51496.1 hypothetical protein FIV42_12295 [Persicimonas caeni]QED32717.1 hypothetical protein FRD00_12290 [Persicimonas caeni]